MFGWVYCVCEIKIVINIINIKSSDLSNQWIWMSNQYKSEDISSAEEMPWK